MWAALCAGAVVLYWPVRSIGFLSDDFLLIQQASAWSPGTSYARVLPAGITVASHCAAESNRQVLLLRQCRRQPNGRCLEDLSMTFQPALQSRLYSDPGGLMRSNRRDFLMA